jgi:hypothetical protein
MLRDSIHQECMALTWRLRLPLYRCCNVLRKILSKASSIFSLDGVIIDVADFFNVLSKDTLNWWDFMVSVMDEV